MQKKGKTIFLILSISFFLLAFNTPKVECDVTWDLLQQEWDSLAGWSQAGSGIVEINPAGQLRIVPDSGSEKYIWRDIGSLPESGYTAEFKLNVDSFPTAGEGGQGGHYKSFYDGQHIPRIIIFSEKIRFLKSDLTYAEYSLSTNEDTWYVWRLLIDSDADSCEVYRDSVFITEFDDPFYDYTSGDGFIYVSLSAHAGGNGEMHEDYLYVATGLHAPIVWYVDFYFTEGGQFRLDNATFTNGTQYEYDNGTNIGFEFQALTYNVSWLFVNFTWDSSYNDTNPYDFNVTIYSNLTVWCNFQDPPYGKLGEIEVNIPVLFVGACIVGGLIAFVLILSRKKR